MKNEFDTNSSFFSQKYAHIKKEKNMKKHLESMKVHRFCGTRKTHE